MPRTYTRLPEDVLFWRKVRKSPGCWEWTGSRHPKTGYGSAAKRDETGRNVTTLAHRMSWMLNRGPIPDGVEVLHDCDNPICVRPDHLHLGTQADNLREARERGRARNGWGQRTECVNGHLYSAENTIVIVRPNGRRRRDCRICSRIRRSAFKRRQRTARRLVQSA